MRTGRVRARRGSGSVRVRNGRVLAQVSLGSLPDGRRLRRSRTFDSRTQAEAWIATQQLEHRQLTNPVTDDRLADYPHFDEGPIHLVTTASLAALADHHGAAVPAARLRANLLVDVGAAAGFVEDRWIGQSLAIGPNLVIRVRERMPRCVMVDLPHKGLPAAPGLLDTTGRINDARVGVVADVVHPGTTRVNDPVELLA